MTLSGSGTETEERREYRCVFCNILLSPGDMIAYDKITPANLGLSEVMGLDEPA